MSMVVGTGSIMEENFYLNNNIFYYFIKSTL